MSAPDLADVARQVEAELARRSFAEFTARFWPEVTGRELEPNRAITAMVDVLQRVADGELHRVLIALPSGVGKSTVRALYAAWRLARDPAHRAIHMTHAADLAGTESRRVRRLVEGDAYRRMFPHVRLRADESTVAAWATDRDGRYYAVGRDSALLGRRALEAYLDDPADVRDRFSPTEREALWAWFEESLMTRLDGDRAPVIVQHQRLATTDLIGRLAEQRDQHGNPVWHLLVLPAEDDDGNLLAPSILTRDKLDELKARNPRVYATMFLQAPSPDDGVAISRKVWRWHAPAGSNLLAPRPAGCATADESPTLETPARFDRMCISVDPTFGGTKSANDFAAVHAWGAAGPYRYLVERWHRKATQLEQRAAILEMARRYPWAVILIEKSAGGWGLCEELRAAGLSRVVPVVARGSKAERFEIVTPTIEQGFAALPIGMPGIAELVEECAGATRHDDDQDAAQIALHWLNVHQERHSGVGTPRGSRAAASPIVSIVPRRDIFGELLAPAVPFDRKDPL